MSGEQQKAQMDAILRGGGLDLDADVPSLRAAFNETMKYVPVADDVVQKPTTAGGVDAIEVTIRNADSPNETRTTTTSYRDYLDPVAVFDALGWPTR